MRAEESVEINRPLQEVFSYVANPKNIPEWSNLALEVREETEGQPHQGYRFIAAAKFLGRRFEMPFEVTAYEPNRLYSHKSTGGPFPVEWTLTFEQAAGGIRLTEDAQGEPGSFFRLVGRLLERATRRQMRTDLETLKDLLESETSQGCLRKVRRNASDTETYRLIHLTSWKADSPKSVCRIGDRRRSEGQGRARSGPAGFRVDHHMSWRCIEMRLTARRGWRGGHASRTSDPATRRAPSPGPSCAIMRPGSAGVGPPHPSVPSRRSAAFVAPRRSAVDPRPLGDAPRGHLLHVWMREDSYVPVKVQTAWR